MEVAHIVHLKNHAQLVKVTVIATVTVKVISDATRGMQSNCGHQKSMERYSAMVQQDRLLGEMAMTFVIYLIQNTSKLKFIMEVTHTVQLVSHAQCVMETVIWIKIVQMVSNATRGTEINSGYQQSMELYNAKVQIQKLGMVVPTFAMTQKDYQDYQNQPQLKFSMEVAHIVLQANRAMYVKVTVTPTETVQVVSNATRGMQTGSLHRLSKECSNAQVPKTPMLPNKATTFAMILKDFKKIQDQLQLKFMMEVPHTVLQATHVQPVKVTVIGIVIVQEVSNATRGIKTGTLHRLSKEWCNVQVPNHPGLIGMAMTSATIQED